MTTLENFDVNAGSDTDDAPTRAWKKEWKEFVANGEKEPGAHPDPNHPYNTDKEAFIQMHNGGGSGSGSGSN